MLENYLLKGLVIGVVFGVPAGVVGILSIQRVLTQGAFAGFLTGIGSSAADIFYACVGVFGLTFISDILLKHQSTICMVGCLMVVAIGVRTIKKTESHSFASAAGNNKEEHPGHIFSCFLSSFVIAITNPATILSFMVVFSMFRIGGNESVGENVQLICGIFAGTCIWWLEIAVIVSLYRKKVTDDVYFILNRIFGALMILFGILIRVDFIQRFGFDSDKHPPHLSMALGAGSVTPWQMVEGFSVFANIGRRTEPYLISKVTDASGKVLMQSTAEAEKVAGVEALDPRNAYIMHQMLHGVATSGTAARATASLKRTDIAGKTGTSNDAFDVWFVGYAGDQCAAVWMGFDQPRSLGRRAQGAGLALPVWIDYMRDAIKNEPNVVRKAPPGVTEEGGNLYYTNRKDAIPNLGLDQPATDDPIGALIHDSSVRGQIF